MTEAVFAAALMALLYFSVRFRETQGWGALCGAGIAAFAGTLTRYEGWFLLPFAAAYFFFTAKRRRVAAVLLFSVLAGAGPLYWLFHNWWLTGDALELLSRTLFGAGHTGQQVLPRQGQLAAGLAVLPAPPSGFARGHGWRYWRAPGPWRRWPSERFGRCCCWRFPACSTFGACIPPALRFTFPSCGRTPTTTLATAWPLCRCWR